MAPAMTATGRRNAIRRTIPRNDRSRTGIVVDYREAVNEVLALRVRSVLRATPTSRILRLDLNDLSYPFTAGQAVMLGRHGQSLRKPFSIACAPEDARRLRALEFLIRIDDDGGLGAPLDPLSRGTLVDAEGPLGSFQVPDTTDERHFLFVAGGTGIAPIRAMLRHVLLTRPDARIGLVYSARSSDEFAYERELRRLAGAGRIRLLLTATRAATLEWEGERGRIDVERLSAMIEDPATLSFVCGPAPLVDDVPAMLRALGMSPARVRIQEW